MRRHVVLYTGESSYGVLTHLTVDLARAFLACGWTSEIVDLSRLSMATEVRRIQREGGAGFFCAFSGYGADIAGNDQLLYDVLGVPYVGLMLDNPCYFPERHFRASDNLLFLHGDDGHHDVSVEISPAGSWRGMFRLAATPYTEPLAPLAARGGNAIFASKGGNPDAYARMLTSRYDAVSRSIMFDIVDAVERQHAPQRVWDVAKARLAVGGIGAGHATSVAFHALVRHADHLARLRRATRVAKALSALPVTFVGGDWTHVQDRRARATFLPPAPLPAVRRMMADSRIVINVQPGTTDSLHDRFILGLHAGAVVVSDSNRYMDAEAGRDAFAPWDGDPDSIAADVARVLDAPDAFQPVAHRGLAVARERLTVARMAATILQAAELHRVLRPTGAAVSPIAQTRTPRATAAA